MRLPGRCWLRRGSMLLKGASVTAHPRQTIPPPAAVTASDRKERGTPAGAVHPDHTTWNAAPYHAAARQGDNLGQTHHQKATFQLRATAPVGATRKPGGLRLKMRQRPLTTFAVVIPTSAPTAVSVSQ
jgi:hypothetical protein